MSNEISEKMDQKLDAMKKNLYDLNFKFDSEVGSYLENMKKGENNFKVTISRFTLFRNLLQENLEIITYMKAKTAKKEINMQVSKKLIS